jgi:hypothetical protein
VENLIIYIFSFVIIAEGHIRRQSVKKGDCKDCGHEAGTCLFCSDVTHNGFESKEKSEEEEQDEDN